MARPRKPFRVCAAYDTETTSVNVRGEWRAFAYLYQINDFRAVELREYEPEKSDDVRLYRDRSGVVEYVRELVNWGVLHYTVPIIAGYNLLFDMQTIFADLCREYGMEVSAQSSTNVYTLDLMRDGERVLRFWDTYHLEMRGLAAMGQTSGVLKMVGDLDYSKIRTPETPLTEKEIGYAIRDVQVIPAYLRYLLEANDWLAPEMLGCQVVTKTSLVRQMAKNEIGPLKVKCGKKKRDLLSLFMALCADDLPGCYYDYALRKACFRGGWTFTAARYASVVVRNVASCDAVSMHHLFINGRMIPEQLRPCDRETLEFMARSVLETSREKAMARYWKPFDFAFHIRVEFKNIRLKKGTCFERWGIALIPRGKFGTSVAGSAEYSRNDAAQEAERMAKLFGWRDSARNAEFAFGKLYAADECVLHVSEVELWTISRVYEWDSMRVLLGEGTAKFTVPPDYVTLQSNLLYKRKSDMKTIVENYTENEPYALGVPASIPPGIAETLHAGSCSGVFIKSYYQSTVKGMYNAIYGTQAQDAMKPDYEVDELLASIGVDHSTVLTPENFFERLPKKPKVHYSYGMRIVGGSRMHLCIAMEHLAESLGERVAVTGGDTDSMKIACASDVTDDEINEALAPVAAAAKSAIDHCMARARRNFPDLSAELKDVGSFEIEKCGEGTRYAWHMEAWNKARVSVDFAGGFHVTCAGLSRPDSAYHMEHYLRDLAQDVGVENALKTAFGYNVEVDSSVAHALQRTNPSALDVFDGDVTDYLGDVCHVHAPEAVALYPVSRMLGETDMPTNAENVAYCKKHYGRHIDMRERRAAYEGGKYVMETEQ